MCFCNYFDINGNAIKKVLEVLVTFLSVIRDMKFRSNKITYEYAAVF